MGWGAEVQPSHPLLGYGALWPDLTRTAVNYVDLILKGAKPGDLPIQQPARLEFVVISRPPERLAWRCQRRFLLALTR